MQRKICVLVLAIALLTISSNVYALEKTKDRLNKGMNNIFIGQIETPDNINESKTKGTNVADCTDKTKSGVERAIARFVGGVWQLGTFWYSDEQ
ncbi:MAG: hypothetical protein ABIJ85_02995 [bacterium]